MNPSGSKDTKSVSEAANYSWRMDLHRTHYLDIRDETGSWRLGTVSEIMESSGMIKLAYDGWLNKYDICLPVESDQIAPLRMFTRGYTGAKKQNQREEFFYTLDESNVKARATIAKVKALIVNPKSMSAFEFTQFVRGELFVIIDGLLTSNFQFKREQNAPVSEAELRVIQELCESYCRLYCKWLSLLPELYSSYLDSRQHKNLYLVSQSAAIASAGPEFTKTLKLFFGFGDRAKLAFEEFAEKFGESGMFSFGGRNMNWFSQHMAGVIEASGGFRQIEALFKQSIPVRLLIEVMKPYVYNMRTKNVDLQKALSAKKLLNDFTIRIRGMSTPAELKQLDNVTIRKMCSSLNKLAVAEDSRGAKTMVAAAVMITGVKLIQTQNVALRVNGLTALNLLISMKSDDDLGRKLAEQQLVEAIFCENLHEEVISRSRDVLLFLLAENAFKPEFVNFVWNCCVDKNEDIARSALAVLTGLLPKLTESSMAAVFAKLKQIPAPGFTEPIIKFLGEYTECAMRLKSKSTLYDLQVLWNIVFDGKCVDKIKEAALDGLARLLNIFLDAKVEYLVFLGLNFDDNINLERSMQVLLRIRFVAFLMQYKLGTHSGVQQLEEFVTKHGLVERTMFCFIDCHKKLSEELAGRNPDKRAQIMSAILPDTGMSFSAQIALYLEFLNSICTASEGISLAKAYIDVLWCQFVKEPICAEHASLFWDAIRREGAEKHIGFFGSQKTTVEFFRGYLGNPATFEVRTMTSSAFSAFRKYFEYANFETLAALRRGNSGYTNDYYRLEELAGVQMLWNIVLKAEVEETHNEAVTLLTNMYYQILSGDDRIDAVSLIESFLLKVLTTPYREAREFRAALKLLRKFMQKYAKLCANLSRTEESDHAEPIDQLFATPPVYTIMLRLPDNYEDIPVTISQKLDTDDLLKWVSNCLGAPKGRILLQDSSYHDVTEEPLESLQKYAKVMVKVKKQLLDSRQTPRYLLANRLALLEKLLELLSNSNSEIAGETWKLLTQLPPNGDLLERAKKLEIKGVDEKDWVEFWGLKSVNDCGKIAYVLYTLISIMERTHEETALVAYKAKMRVKKGVQFLTGVFNHNTTKHYSWTILKCLSFCLQLVERLWEPELANMGLQDVAMQKTLWSSVSGIIQYVIEVQHKAKDKSVMMVLDSGEEIALLDACVNLHIRLVAANPELFQNELLSPAHLQILEPGLFCADAKVRDKSQQLLHSIYLRVICPSKARPELEPAFVQFLLEKTLDKVLQMKEGCSTNEFFCLLTKTLSTCADETLKLAISEKRLSTFSDYIVASIAGKGGDVSTLCGMTELVAVLVGKSACLAFPPRKLEDLFAAVMDLLFGTAGTKTESVKNKAFILLGPLAKVLGKESQLISMLYPLHLNVGWRTEKADDWNISSEGTGTKNFNGYVGLSNMGATCYVNSVLQQLFMIPAFRDSLLSLPIVPGIKAEKEVLAQLQKVFCALYEKQVSAYKSKELYDAMDVDVNVQKDASEFLITLFDRLQEPLKRVHMETLVKDLFEISTAGKITCGTCKTANEVPATSLLLSVEVKNKKSLVEGLQALLKPETLRGDNAYYCKNCTAKVSAERQEMVKSLPNILLIQLKRFEQSYEAMNKKLNSFYEFPLELDLKELIMTAQGKAPREGTWAEIDKTYYRYSLRGVVVHMGIMNSGHYYSLVRDLEKEAAQGGRPYWVKFNDTSVDPFNIADIAAEAFGNKDERLYVATDEDAVLKSSNAYILVYQREVMLNPKVMRCVEAEEVIMEDPREILKEIETCKELRKGIKPVRLSPEVTGKLAEEQKEYLTQQRLFNPYYIRFAMSLVQSQKPAEAADEEKLAKTEEFAFRFLLTTALRSTMKPEAYCLTRHLQAWCQSSKKLSTHLLNAFLVPANLREFVLDCPKPEARRCICSLLKSAATTLYDSEKEPTLHYLQSEEGKCKDKAPLLIRLGEAFMQQLDKTGKNNCGQYFEFLAHFARLGPAISAYLARRLMIGSSLEILGLSKNTHWREHASAAISHSNSAGSNEVPSFLEPSKKCYMTATDPLVEKQFATQVPFILSFLVELLEPFAFVAKPVDFPADFDCIGVLVDSVAMKELIRIAGESRASMDRVARLINVLCIVKNGGYVEKVLGLLGYGLKECETTELPVYFRVCELLLAFDNYVLNYEVFSTLVREATTELKKRFSYEVEYVTSICYIDFFIKVFRENKRCLAQASKASGNEDAWGLLNEVVVEWLKSNKCVTESMKLFRRSSAKAKSSPALERVSKQAGQERMDAISKIRKECETAGENEGSRVVVTEFSILEQEHTIKIGQKLDVLTCQAMSQSKKWVKGEVMDACGCAVKVSLPEDQKEWIESESERVVREGTKTDSVRLQEGELLFAFYVPNKK